MPKRSTKRQEKPKTTAQRLDSIVKSARKIMRKDKGLNGDLDRLPMLTWIMFLKFLDDLEHLHEEEAKLAGKKFHPAIERPYRWRDWAAQHDGITGPDLIRFITAEETKRPDGSKGPGLFTYLRGLRGRNGGRDRRDVVATVFRGVSNRMESGYLLRDVVNLVDGIHFDSSDEIHTLSRLYEGLLREMRDAAGDSGEFYTPRPVIRFMVEVVNPQLGEVVLDPACGTGGFLAEAFAHLERQTDTVQKREILQEASLRGCEPKTLPYLLAEMNLLLHGLEAPEVDSGNALRFRLSEIGDKDRVDVILTNPPFGGEEEAGILTNFPDDRRTTETALLFLQLIMRKLKRGGKGRAGVVVPHSTLFGDGVAARIKADLLEHFNLHTIIRLPDGVFAPYTDIPTNLIFFDTSGPTREVWFYEQPSPEGRRKYSKTQPLQYEEFSDCLAWYSDRSEGPRSWKLNARDLVERDGEGRVVAVNLDRKNPQARGVIDPRAPAEIVASMIAKEEEACALLAETQRIVATLADSSDVEREAWTEMPLGKILREAGEPHNVDPESSYPNLGVYSFARGLFPKAPIEGNTTSASVLYRVRAGQFIYSRLFAFEGAYAIVPEELDGYFVSNEFPTFDIDQTLVMPEFLAAYFQSPLVWERVATDGSLGLGNRRQRVQAPVLLRHRLRLPPREWQERIVAIQKCVQALRRIERSEIDRLLPVLVKRALP